MLRRCKSPKSSANWRARGPNYPSGRSPAAVSCACTDAYAPRPPQRQPKRPPTHWKSHIRRGGMQIGRSIRRRSKNGQAQDRKDGCNSPPALSKVCTAVLNVVNLGGSALLRSSHRPTVQEAATTFQSDHISPTKSATCPAAAMPLGKRTDFGDARYTGLEVPFSSDVEKALEVRPCCCRPHLPPAAALALPKPQHCVATPAQSHPFL